MRKLETRDVFPCSKIISKIGFNELKGCFSTPKINEIVKGKKQDDNLLMEVGTTITFELLGVVLSNLDKVDYLLLLFVCSFCTICLTWFVNLSA